MWKKVLGQLSTGFLDLDLVASDPKIQVKLGFIGLQIPLTTLLYINISKI